MSRVTNSEKGHVITLAGDMNRGELLLVKGGRNAYLWVGDRDVVITFSGPSTLRKLATAILNEVGDP